MKTIVHTFLQTFKLTAKLFGSHKRLWIPFVIVALLEALFILCIWLAPHPPFSKFFAPPIRFFFSDRFLHYPWHLWFLFYAMKHTHLVASIILGAFMSGIVCAMVKQTHESKSLSMHSVLSGKQVKYGRVVLLWVIAWGIARAFMELYSRYAPQTEWSIPIVLTTTIIIQALFVYAIPIAVFKNVVWWRAFLQSFKEAAQHPLLTLLVVIPPSALIILFSMKVSPTHVIEWMVNTTPELVLFFIVARLIVWVFADAFLTVAVSHLYLVSRSPSVVGKNVAEKRGAADSSKKQNSLSEEGPAVA